MAQGVKDGGSTKRRCVPRGGAAPGSLQRAEAGRTKGLDAFEGRMVSMNVMEADVRDALVGRGGSWCYVPICRVHDYERGGAGLTTEDGGGPDRGVGRVRGEDGGYGSDGTHHPPCLSIPTGREEMVESVAQGLKDEGS